MVAEIRKIIHVDMDAFYASVEQRDNPEHRGKPVAVGHGARRGVVAAASYEARAFGVRSALPSLTAMRQCPELIFVEPRFDVYRSVSQQIHAIFAEFTDLIEPLALDEAYLDVTANKATLETAWQTAKAIRARIKEETGLNASAGVSYNKFLAKLASSQRKPNGQFAIQPHDGAAFVATLPVAKFHGVGPATTAKMHGLGIHTGADLKAWSLQDLQARFGKSGPWYYAIARGEDHRPVNPSRVRKSSGSETTFEEDLVDPVRIEAGVLEMADDVWASFEAFDRYLAMPDLRLMMVGYGFGDDHVTTRMVAAAAAPDAKTFFVDPWGIDACDPLAISTVKQIRESSFDIRATSRLNRLYVELLKDNPDWATAARRPDMNHFMARLIFCFFAEDTDIFSGTGLFTATVAQMGDRDASNTHEIISAVSRTYHEQLNGYDHLKTLDIGYFFYSGSYLDSIMKVLDPDLKTIVHIPNVNSRESTADKIKEANEIMSALGDWEGEDPKTGFHLIRRPDGRLLKVADLVEDDGARRDRVIGALKDPAHRGDRDHVDIIIALGMAKEGFDWIWCEHALIIAGFEDILKFVKEHGRAPQHGEGRDIFERLYAMRLDRIRGQADCRELVAPMDTQGLLAGGGGVSEPAGEFVDDADLLAELGVALAPEEDITVLKHVRSRDEVRAAEEIANRAPCEDFDRFKSLFEGMQAELAAGVRETREFGRDPSVAAGDFFILGGQVVYVAEIGEAIKAPNGESDARLRAIFANGTESNLLRRSLQRALYKDETGRRVTAPSAGPLFGGVSQEDDLESGTIYVLRSKSDHPEVAAHRDLIHKIGVTGGAVEARIAQAATDATYLLAEVEIVATYKLFNINRTKLENLLHRVFAPARLSETRS